MSSKMRASSARMSSDKACAKLNEKNALKSQTKVAPSNVSKPSSRAVLNVRISPENESQNETSSKNRIMLKKDGNSKTRKKSNGLVSPKCSKRTHKVRDLHSLDVNINDQDRENEDGIKSVITNETHSVTKDETDSNILEKTDEMHVANATKETFIVVNGDVENIRSCEIADTAKHAPGNLENVCEDKLCAEKSVDASVHSVMAKCNQTSRDCTNDTDINKIPRTVLPSNLIQQRFPLRSKLKKPSARVNCIPEIKTNSNILRTKVVTQFNVNLSETYPGKESTPRSEITRVGKQHQSKLPSSKSKITHPMSNNAESDKKVKLDIGIVSEQSDSSITPKLSSPDVCGTIYSKKESEQIVPKIDSVIIKTCTNELACLSQNPPSVTKSDKETNFISEELSILSTSSSNASSLTTSTADKKKPESEKEKCTIQTGATAKQNVVKHKILSKELEGKTNLGKTSTIQRSLHSAIKQNTNNKSDRIGTINNEKVSLKSRQRSVIHEANSDDDCDDNIKSIPLASQANIKSRSISDTVNNRSNSKQTGGQSSKDNLKSTKIDRNTRPSSDKTANSRTSTLNRIPKTKSSLQFKKDSAPKFANLDRSTSSTSSRESTSRSKSRSASRSRSSTPNSVKPRVDTGGTSDRKSTTWKSKSSSRDSSSRSRSSTPSVTSSISDDNRHDITKTKVVNQSSVTKRPVSKLKIPLRTSIPTCNTMDKNTSDMTVKLKANSETRRNPNTENNVDITPGPLSNRKMTNNSVNRMSAMTRNVSICKPSSVRNSSSRSRSSTPEESSAYVRKQRDSGTTLQKSSASNISVVNVRQENIAKVKAVESKNSQVKKVCEMKSRESTSRSRSTTPSSATSSDGSKSSTLSSTNKTRRITNTKNTKTKTDMARISRQIECTKQQESIPNTRLIKRTSGIPSRSNKHSPDIKDNKTRKPATSSDCDPKSSELNATRTATHMNPSLKANNSKLPLIASSSEIASRIIPKLQKRSEIQKRQYVQSQITQRESPTTTDKPPAKSAHLSIQPSTSIKVAKVTISTENKSSKNVTKTVNTRTIARSVNLKADQKRNKAFVSGNKSGLITSLALVKKDNVGPCLDNESKKQISLEEKETKPEIEDHNTSFELKPCGTDLLLDNMDNSITSECEHGIVLDTKQTIAERSRNVEIIGNSGFNHFDGNVQNTNIHVDNAVCINAEMLDTHGREKCNKNESQLKNQHTENLIRPGNFDSTDKHMESVENHDWNSTDENSSCVVCDPRFEVSINCSSRRQLSKYNGEHDGAWLEMSHEENTGLRSNRSIDETLQNLCQENMSKFYSEMESLRGKNSAYRRNINANDQSNLITDINSSAKDTGKGRKYSSKDVNVEITQSKNQSSNNDGNNSGTVILIQNTALNSSDVHVAEVNNYAEDQADKPMLSSGNETSVPSQAYKCQIDKKSEISTFHIDMCTVNSSQQMPINDVSLPLHTEPNDFFNDKDFNIVASTPSGALSIQNTNKRQDKKITFDSTCVLCNRFCPCIHLDVKQQNDVLVCVEVCENCEWHAASQITTKNVNVLNSGLEESGDDISANLGMDETTDVLCSDTEKTKEVNSDVMNVELINNGTLSFSSDPKLDQQSIDVVTDNTEVLNICNEDANDEQNLANNDLNTKNTQKCEIISPTRTPNTSSNIEHSISDWQETFLFDKKCLENNTDVEILVPNNCKINKETSCCDRERTTVCLCSDENKTNILNISMDKIKMDVTADDVAPDVRGQSDNTFSDILESKVTSDKTDMERNNKYQGVDQSDKLTVPVTQNSDDYTDNSDMVTVLALSENTKKTKESNTIPLDSVDNTFLGQQNANKQNDESTSHTHCFHEKDSIVINGGHDRSCHRSCTSVCFIQKAGKIEHPCENRKGNVDVLRHDLSPTNNESEPEIPNENLRELNSTSDVISNSQENIMSLEDTGVPIVPAQVQEQSTCKDRNMSNIGALINMKPDKNDNTDANVKTAHNMVGERTTTQIENISWQNIHDSRSFALNSMTCEQYDGDHPVMDNSQNKPPSENKHISKDNNIIPANLLSNSKQDIDGNVPSVLFPTEELSLLQADVKRTYSYNIDETTSVHEIGENLPECFDSANNSGGIFSQQVINYDITGTACAVDNGNLTRDTWAESACLENQSQNTNLKVEMSVTSSSVKDRDSLENQVIPSGNLQEHIEVNSVFCKPNDTIICVNDFPEQTFICTDSRKEVNYDYLIQTPNNHSPRSQMDSEINSGFQTVSGDNSEIQSVGEHKPNVYSLDCSENRSDDVEQGFYEQLRTSAVTEEIRQRLMLSEQSPLSDSDTSNIQDEQVFQSQTGDLSGHISTTGNTVLISDEETLSNKIDNSDRKLPINGNILLLQNYVDSDTCQIVDQSSRLRNSERNISAPSNLQIKLFNEQFDNRTCAFDANTCSEINHSLDNLPLSSEETLQSEQVSEQESALQNKGEEDWDLELVSRINEGNCDNFSVVDQKLNVPSLSNVELNTKSEKDKSTNEELNELKHIIESERNTKHACLATDDGLSDIGDTFVDAEDSDKTEVQIELNDTKENRLSLISVNTSTDSFVDAVESLDDEYLTSSVFRHSREIQNEETLSQNSSDANNVSSDISDSIDDLSGWEEFTENIEDIGDINSSEMEINPHKIPGAYNRFSVRRSELQHHSSVSRIRTILQDKYNQNTTPSPKRETIISSVNETKQISSSERLSEPDTSDISKSIFKTGNVYVSGEVKSQSVIVETRNDTSDGDNGYYKNSDALSTDSVLIGPQFVNVKDSPSNGSSGHNQNSDKRSSQASVVSRIETALIKRTQRRRRRHVEHQPKAASVEDSNIESNVNTIHTTLNSKDGGTDNGCIENTTCTHSRNSETSQSASDNITFNNKVTSGNESLSSQNNSDIELNISKLDTNLRVDKQELNSDKSLSLHDHSNARLIGVDNNETSVCLTITTEPVQAENFSVDQICTKTSDMIIQTACIYQNEQDNKKIRTEPGADANYEVTSVHEAVPCSSNGTPELDDIEFIDADEDSETALSSQESNEVSSEVSTDLSSDHLSTPSVCVTISLENTIDDTDTVDNDHEINDRDTDCTVIEVDSTINEEKESNNGLEAEDQRDEHINVVSIVSDIASNKVNINVESSNESVKCHDFKESSENIASSDKRSIQELSSESDKAIRTKIDENSFDVVINLSDGDLNRVSPDDNNSNTEIVEESNISVKHALEIERLKLADTLDARSRKALFDSKRSGRRATIETSSIDLNLELIKDKHEEPKPKVTKPLQKSKSFRYEKKTISPVAKDDKTEQVERAVSPVSQKVSDICKSFMTKTRSSIKKSREQSASKSPAPQRKLMKWVCDHGKWLRIPIDEINDGQRSEIGSPDVEVVESLSSPDVDSKHGPQLNSPIQEATKRLETPRVKSQPPPVPQKTVDAKIHTQNKELNNSSLKISKYMEAHQKSESVDYKTPMENVDNMNNKDVLAEKTSNLPNTKCDVDSVMPIQFGPSVTIQPIDKMIAAEKMQTVEGNASCDTNANVANISQEPVENQAQPEVSHKAFEKGLDLTNNVDVKVNDTLPQPSRELSKTDESDEKSSQEVKVIGTALEGVTSQDTHLRRQELLFGLLDSYNRRKPRRISNDEISRRCASPIGMRTGYMVDKDDDKKYETKDNEQEAEKAVSIPKIKAVKIQEEIFECKNEYIKANNLKLNDDLRSGCNTPKTKSALRKSKTFSGMEVFERQHEPQKSDSSRRNELESEEEQIVSSIVIPDQEMNGNNDVSKSKSLNSKMIDKRARAGLKLQIEKAKQRSRSSEADDSPNRLSSNHTSRSQGDRSPNRLSVNQSTVRMRSPDKGPRIQRPKVNIFPCSTIE